MNSTAPSSPPAPNRRTYSCIRCYDRKVKCDRGHPCGGCVKHNATCIFRSQPPTSRKRRKRVNHDVASEHSSHKNSISAGQDVDHNESLARLQIADKEEDPSLRGVDVDRRGAMTKTQLVSVQGRSQFVDNSLWTRVIEEVQDQDTQEDDSYESSETEASDDEFSYALGSTPSSNTKVTHPPIQQIQQLWQYFVENVDPLTKVVHVPTLKPAVQKAIDDIDSVPRSFEALLFAIYSTAVLSLNDEQCRQKFGESRDNLLSRYTSATKRALSRARFMSSVNLIVLQALVLHIVSVRDIVEPRASWTLTGVAIRIAESMGLHHDGTVLKLSVFETEIRRRIWWYLKMHDFRTAELCGLPKFRGVESLFNACKRPANVNDDQLYPTMTSPPEEVEGSVSSMIFCCSRMEFFGFALRENNRFKDAKKDEPNFDEHELSDGWTIKEAMIKRVEDMMEEKYIRYCDPSVPLQLIAMICARTGINVGRFIAHHPRRWVKGQHVPDSERQYVWNLALRLIEQFNICQTNPQAQQFAWHTIYFLQWHALIHIIDTLQANPLKEDAEKAWQIVETVYKYNPDFIKNTKRAMYVAVGNLCLKAYRARETALMSQGGSLQATPEFITKLREQREAAKARRNARTRMNKAERTNSEIMNPDLSNMISNTSAALSGSESRQYESIPNPHSQSMFFDHSQNYNYNTDMNWFNNGFDSLLGSSNDMMNVDTDFMLAQDQSMENSPGQGIDWTQWDAWASNMNMSMNIEPANAFVGLQQGAVR